MKLWLCITSASVLTHFVDGVFCFEKENPKKVKVMVENELKKVSKYYQLQHGKLSYTDDNIIQMKGQGNDKIVGFSSIINHFHEKIEKENKNSENYFLQKQFFDFANLFIRSTSKRDKCKLLNTNHQNFSFIKFNFSDAACLEINGYLESRSYLIGQSISLADIVVFYAISDVMKQLSPHEKDSYLNLSRWFDHLQQQEKIRQGGSEVNFSTIHLLGWTARVSH